MNKTLFWIAVAAVIVVALVAGIVSYDHLHTVAVAAGEQDWIAKLVPLSADGLLVSASLSAFVAKWQSRKVHAMTKLSLAVSLTASIAANIASPFVGGLTGTSQDILAAIVGAWPAIALALSFEEVLRLSSMWKVSNEVATGKVSSADPSKAEATTEEVTAVATEVAALPEVTAEVLPETVAVPEAEVIPTPEVISSPEPATAPMRKRAAVSGSSAKAEALRYLADKPETSAAQLALRFDRSDRWARMIRKDFQESGKRLELVTA